MYVSKCRLRFTVIIDTVHCQDTSKCTGHYWSACNCLRKIRRSCTHHNAIQYTITNCTIRKRLFCKLTKVVFCCRAVALDCIIWSVHRMLGTCQKQEWKLTGSLVTIWVSRAAGSLCYTVYHRAHLAVLWEYSAQLERNLAQSRCSAQARSYITDNQIDKCCCFMPRVKRGPWNIL